MTVMHCLLGDRQHKLITKVPLIFQISNATQVVSQQKSGVIRTLPDTFTLDASSRAGVVLTSKETG